MSEREDQDGDCLATAFLCLPVMSCHMNRGRDVCDDELSS